MCKTRVFHIFCQLAFAQSLAVLKCPWSVGRCHPAAHGGRRGVPVEQGHEHGVQPHHRQALRRPRRHHARPQHDNGARRTHEVQGAGPHPRPQPTPGEPCALASSPHAQAVLLCTILSIVTGFAAVHFIAGCAAILLDCAKGSCNVAGVWHAGEGQAGAAEAQHQRQVGRGAVGRDGGRQPGRALAACPAAARPYQVCY